MIGVTNSSVRILVDTRSIQPSGPLRTATIRLGSPRSLAGRIVETRQYQRFDCAARRWALLGYEAYDENGKVIDRKPSGSASASMESVTTNSLGETVLDFVCAYDPDGAGGNGPAMGRSE